MNKARKIIAFVVGVFLFTACSNLPTYEKAYTFKDKVWKQNVKPVFVVDIQDTSKAYNFTLTLRTTTDYKYSNLWVYLNTKTPKKQTGREAFEIKTTYPDGTWIGTKTGTIVEHTLNFNKRKLPEKGNYVFILEQGITQSIVDEVLDISLIVEEVK
jgi:gliding motility-associated lipoprotein GldH